MWNCVVWGLLYAFLVLTGSEHDNLYTEKFSSAAFFVVVVVCFKNEHIFVGWGKDEEEGKTLTLLLSSHRQALWLTIPYVAHIIVFQVALRKTAAKHVFFGKLIAAAAVAAAQKNRFNKYLALMHTARRHSIQRNGFFSFEKKEAKLDPI